MIFSKSTKHCRSIIAGTLFAGSILVVSAFSQALVDKQNSLSPSPTVSSRSSQPHSTSPYHATAISAHAKSRYESLWGVDSLDVKAVESGQLVRFSYFVLDPSKASQLNDNKAAPSLIDEQAQVRLEVPIVDKVGQLRQSSTPEAGRSYWMVFSNKGGIVKPGDRVSVVIGNFRADGLLVR